MRSPPPRLRHLCRKVSVAAAANTPALSATPSDAPSPPTTSSRNASSSFQHETDAPPPPTTSSRNGSSSFQHETPCGPSWPTPFACSPSSAATPPAAPRNSSSVPLGRILRNFPLAIPILQGILVPWRPPASSSGTPLAPRKNLPPTIPHSLCPERTVAASSHADQNKSPSSSASPYLDQNKSPSSSVMWVASGCSTGRWRSFQSSSGDCTTGARSLRGRGSREHDKTLSFHSSSRAAAVHLLSFQSSRRHCTTGARPDLPPGIQLPCYWTTPEPTRGSRTTPVPELVLCRVSCIRNDNIVLRDVSLTVHEGGAVLLTGPNGSGKSTLLRLVAGFLRPSAGYMLWRGLDLTNSDVYDYFRVHVHLVTQKDAIKNQLTVDENVRFWAAVEGTVGRVDWALHTLGLAPLAKSPASTLSLGQRKRLQLARLLAMPRSIWLLDEPSVGLDAEGLKFLEDAILEHRRCGGMTLVATHTPIDIPNSMHLRFEARR